ncbi:MAG: hypothetical protein ACTS85_00840 [Arsenophonus sp. NC-PG7-MAG3]
MTGISDSTAVKTDLKDYLVINMQTLPYRRTEAIARNNYLLQKTIQMSISDVEIKVTNISWIAMIIAEYI